MNHASLDQVKNEFNLSSTDLNTMKSELRKLLKRYHTDTGGENSSQEDFDNVINALTFINSYEKTNNSLIPLSQALTVFQQFNSPKIDNYIKDCQEKLALDLEQSGFKSKISWTKITAAFTTVISASWVVLNKLVESPILKNYLTILNPIIFGLILLGFLALLIIYVLLKSAEIIDDDLKSNLKVESVQNELFEYFIKHRAREFTKQDFINETNDAIERNDLLNPNWFLKKKRIKDKIYNFLKVGRIDLNTAQTLADMLFHKAESKRIIRKITKEKALFDYYCLVEIKNDEIPF